MMTIEALIKKWPLPTYFILTFAISLGGAFIVVGPTGILGTSEETKRLLMSAIIALELGPILAGILLTGLVGGRVGLRELLSRFLRWRVSARWYAVALLTVPLLAMPTLFVLSQTSPIFLPSIVTTGNTAALLLMGIAVGLMAGVCEEVGWTGFALPRLRLRYSIPAAGLILGFVWGAWHVPLTFWGSGDSSGVFSSALFLPPFLFYVGVLPAYRVLMVWVYDRTKSLFVAMLMHASLSANTMVILMPTARGTSLMTYYLVFAAALWVVVAAILVASRGRLSETLPTTKLKPAA